MDHKIVRAVVQTMFFGGLRISEAVSLLKIKKEYRGSTGYRY